MDYQQNGTTELCYVRTKNSGMVWGRKIHTFCINSSRLIKRENKLEMCMLHKVWECDLVCCICTAWNFNTIQSSKFHWKSFKPRCYLGTSQFVLCNACLDNEHPAMVFRLPFSLIHYTSPLKTFMNNLISTSFQQILRSFEQRYFDDFSAIPSKDWPVATIAN